MLYVHKNSLDFHFTVCNKIDFTVQFLFVEFIIYMLNSKNEKYIFVRL